MEELKLQSACSIGHYRLVGPWPLGRFRLQREWNVTLDLRSLGTIEAAEVLSPGDIQVFGLNGDDMIKFGFTA